MSIPITGSPSLFITCGLLVLLSYFSGSIPFGLLLTRLTGQGDIRKTGSGNIGATNVLRTGRKDLALLTFFLDALKGCLVIFLVRSGLFDFLFDETVIMSQPGQSEAMEALLGFAAVAGHCFPVWLHFRGGKGFATFVGVVFSLDLWLGLCLVLTWLATAFFLRFSSLAALLGLLIVSSLGFLFLSWNAALVVVLLCVFVTFRHKGNIVRLVKGREPGIKI